MTPNIDVIAFDADDTLWHTESLYSNVEAKIIQILAPYQSQAIIEQVMHSNEIRNLEFYGYGIKSFILSLVESAAQISQSRVQGSDILRIIELGKEMLTADIQLLEQTRPTLDELSSSYPLMLITKGDLNEQEPKIKRSGLLGYFKYIDVLTDKTPSSYTSILDRYKINPTRFLMVGNSLRSDIAPVLSLGGWAVYIPYSSSWSHENASIPESYKERYYEIKHLGELPDLLYHLVNQ